jgi:hypothetical protein
VNVQVSNNLQSGRYVLAFGAHSAISKDIYFLVPHAATVDVLDISHDSSPYTGKHLCLVNGQANWEIRDGE